METKIDKKTLLKWIVSFAVPFLIWLIPTNEIFTADLRLFLVVTILVILLVACEFFNLIIPAILLPLLYILSGLSTFQVAFSGFTSSTSILVLAALMFAEVAEESGLLKRVAYWCVLKTGGSYLGILYGIVFGGIAITFMTSGNGIYIVAILCYSICKAFDFGVSLESALVMLCGAFASTTIRACVYTPGLIAIVLAGANAIDPSITITWGGFFFQNWPYLVMILALPVLLVKIFKPKVQVTNGKEYFKEQYDALGPVSKKEKIAAVLTVILLVSLLTASWHKVDMSICFFLVTLCFFLPGINIGTDENIKNVNYPMYFFVVACLGIGSVATQLGFGDLVSSTLTPMLQGLGENAALAAIWVFGTVANFLLTPVAILAGFTAPITQLAIDLGINPLGAIYVLFNTLDQIVLPYEYVNYLMFFSFGVMSMKDFFKIMSTKLVFGVIFLAIIMIPYWNLVGVL